MTTETPQTEEEKMQFVRYKDAAEFRQVYQDKEYNKRLFDFIEVCSDRVYQHCKKTGEINFPKNKPDMFTKAGQLVNAHNSLRSMFGTNFLVYDLLDATGKYMVQEGFYSAEINYARVGKLYGF